MAKKKKTSLGDITSQFEKKAIGRAIKLERDVVDMQTSIINQIAYLASIQKMPKGVFTLSKLATLNNRLDTLIKQLNANTEFLIRNGINDVWQLSNEKNNIFADIRLDKSLIPSDKKVVFYEPNISALKAFQERQVFGLNLSERVYKAGEIFKAELEAGIGLGINEGQSAAELGRALKSYLKEPNNLFRRVKDEEGNFKLSKRAEMFNPGQGVYRSSRANIERLTRTEINTAYRTADNTRWQKMPFVLGQEVHTSGSHPKYDICDELKGDYPSDYVFIGFHPQCICFSVPKLMNDEEFESYQQLVLKGEDTPANIDKIANPISEIPLQATNWMVDNAERISNWKNPPLWYDINSKYIPK